MSGDSSLVRGRVLLVDDDALLLRAFARHLIRADLDVETCSNGAQAVERARSGTFDVIVSDISMPDMDGIEMLRCVRDFNRDLPVILMTGAPAIESAMRAVEFGAFQYLVKPCVADELTNAVQRAVRLYRLARMKREALTVLGTGAGEGSGRAGLEASFERAMSGLWMAFQPVVRASDGSLFGYEALLRSEEPTLPHPAAVFDAAERLGMLRRLGWVLREKAASPMHEADPAWHLFVNLHPDDLLDLSFSEEPPLSSISGRVVLEVTERASLDKVPEVRSRVAVLRRLGFRIAIDDFGAGYAGLSSFVLLEPEIIKLDTSLVRDVDAEPVKQKLVRTMTALAKDMGLSVVAKGVETTSERDVLVELGCDLLQGYLFGKPSRPFSEPPKAMSSG